MPRNHVCWWLGHVEESTAVGIERRMDMVGKWWPAMIQLPSVCSIGIACE